MVSAAHRRPAAAGLLPLLLAVLALLGAACGQPTDAEASIYRIRLEQCLGATTQRATAVAVAPDLVATVAHSFEEPGRLMLTDAAGTEVAAEIVYLDLETDIALLRIDRETDAVLTLGDPGKTGAITFATFADADGPVVRDGEILDRVRATLDGVGPRSALRLQADIEPGDSGAPVIDEDEQMVGMIFATVRGKDVGWAVSASEIGDALVSLDEQGPGDYPLACS